jgi:glucose/arabinose dehydrogenase
MRPLTFVALFVVAQAVTPDACGSRPPGSQPPPPPSTDPTITDQFTTQDGIRLGVQTVVTNVEIPWSIVFAPDGRMFFTERAGRVRVFENGQLRADPVLVVGDVRHDGEGGLLGMALHPNFATNRLVYLLYTTDTAAGRINRLVRYREVNNTLGDRAVLLERMAGSGIHNGGRIRFGPDGRLYVTMGDAANTALSQQLSSLNGKILRLNDDGSAATGNPFMSEVWTWGHRNPQGIDWNPLTTDLWSTEHGQSANDEINLLRSGRNYGWPVIEGSETRPDMEAPVRFFAPSSVAPSGGSFYTGTLMAGLRFNFIFGTLAGRHIHRVVLEANDMTRIATTERWLENRFGRIRDVVTGPDGALYFCTNNRDGRGSPTATDDRIARIVPVQ